MDVLANKKRSAFLSENRSEEIQACCSVDPDQSGECDRNITKNFQPKEMSENFLIFVIKDTDEEFEKRMDDKSWPIYSHTSNRRKLQAGDKVVFYKAGVGNKTILGTAEVASGIKPQGRTGDYTVSLRKIGIWKKPVLLKPIVGDLDFVDNKEQWGRYMQGGTIKLSEKDYNTIASNSN